MNETGKWNFTKQVMIMCLMLLEEDDRRGLIDYDDLMIEMKELGVYALENADILYSSKGLRLLTLAAFFGMPTLIDGCDFTQNAWRCGKLTVRSLDHAPTGDVLKWFPKKEERNENDGGRGDGRSGGQLKLW